MSRSTAAQRQLSRSMGTCIDFGSSGNNGVNCGTGSSFNVTTNVTLCCWIYLYSYGAFRGIMGRRSSNESANPFSNFGMGVNGAGSSPTFSIATASAGSSVTAAAATVMNLNQWYFIAGTYDQSTNTLLIYVNGVQDGTASSSLTIGASTAPFRFGVGDPLTGSQYLRGMIDDGRVYSRTLTAAEISGLYYGFEPSTSGLISRWKFDEGSGTTANDSVGTNTGTITGATYATNTFPTAARSTNGARPILTSFGSAVDLTAANAQVSWGNIQGNTNTVVTASLLWKPTNNSSSNQETIWGYGNQRWFFIYGDTTTSLRFTIKISGVENATANVGPLTIGQWYRIIGTYDPAGGAGNLTIRIYDLTGTLVFSNSATTTGAIDTSASAMQLGHDPNRNFYIKGKAADCRVWGRILTVTEQDNLALGITPSSTNLLLWTKFNEGSGTTALDYSGNNQSGTLTNATYTSSDVPVYRTTA